MVITARGVLLFLLLVLALPLQAAPKFPELTGRVVDQAGILTAHTKNQLDSMLAQHEAATSNQVVVATLNSLQGYPIEDFGYQLGRYWAIGQKGKDNGVLLIVAPKERKVRIEVGYGLEGSLTDALSKNIIEAVITPRFKQGDMNGGVLEGTRAILSAIQGTYKPQKNNRSAKSSNAFDFFGVAVIFTIVLGGIVRHFIGNRLVASLVMGGIAFVIGLLIFSVIIGAFAGVAVFLISLFTGLGGGGGHYGGGYYSGGHSSGGSFGGGFSGGGGSFGGGGASGGW